MLKDYNQAKAIKECTIKYFTFYYNYACIVYKSKKYSTGWWLEELKLD